MEEASLTLGCEARQKSVLGLISRIHVNSKVEERVKNIYKDQMDLGMEHGLKKSSLLMETTYVTRLLDGSDNGSFLALDLGGTNFRVLFLELASGKVTKEEMKHYQVDEATRLGEGSILFTFLASCIHSFLSEFGILDRSFSLGFCFSFPMEQEGLALGRLVSWTKSFNCPGVEGEEVVGLLQNAIDARGDMKVKVIAILNDTTGTLVAGSYLDPNCTVGVIMGSGNNGCYLESIDNVIRWKGKKGDAKQVIIDSEFGAFGDPGLGGVLEFLRTEYDNAVDAGSLLPNKYTYEKYCGGNFMGELARIVMCKIYDSGLFNFSDKNKILNKEQSFPTKFITQIDLEDWTSPCEFKKTNTWKLVTKWLSNDKEDDFGVTEDDLLIIKAICSLITGRSALLLAICVAEIVSRIDKVEQTVAIDGSVFKHHLKMRDLLASHVKRMVPGKNIKLMLAEDGSGKGAAFLAAIASKTL